jgi:hypothetical protein
MSRSRPIHREAYPANGLQFEIVVVKDRHERFDASWRCMSCSVSGMANGHRAQDQALSAARAAAIAHRHS